MKKLTFLFLLLSAAAINSVYAQTTLITTAAPGETIFITGTVKTTTGDPLHFAFVQDKQYKYAAFTDSLGNFTLTVNPNSKLLVNCRGFKDTLIQIKGRTSFIIALNYDVQQPNQDALAGQTAEIRNDVNMATLTDFRSIEPNTGATQTGIVNGKTTILSPPTADMAQGAIFPVFNHKEETQGSRYLFSYWAHGYVLNNKDSIVQKPIFLFNYDKIGGNLLLTKDQHAAIAVYRDLVKTFTLYDELGQPYTFTMVPEIDKGHFVQVLASGNNYKIYKLIKTTFTKANYSSDGVASTGNNFDSYDDEVTYYTLDVKTNQLQKLELKKKALKVVFANQADKLNKFMTDNSGNIDEVYLGSLGDFLNK